MATFWIIPKLTMSLCSSGSWQALKAARTASLAGVTSILYKISKDSVQSAISAKKFIRDGSYFREALAETSGLQEHEASGDDGATKVQSTFPWNLYVLSAKTR